MFAYRCILTVIVVSVTSSVVYSMERTSDTKKGQHFLELVLHSTVKAALKEPSRLKKGAKIKSADELIRCETFSSFPHFYPNKHNNHCCIVEVVVGKDYDTARDYTVSITGYFTSNHPDYKLLREYYENGSHTDSSMLSSSAQHRKIDGMIKCYTYDSCYTLNFIASTTIEKLQETFNQLLSQ